MSVSASNSLVKAKVPQVPISVNIGLSGSGCTICTNEAFRDMARILGRLEAGDIEGAIALLKAFLQIP